MEDQSLADIVQPTAQDLARTRQHPAYVETMRKLNTSGNHIIGQTIVPLNVDNLVVSARDSVAQEIKNQLRPLHAHGIGHLGVVRETEICEDYNAQVLALQDAGYNLYK